VWVWCYAEHAKWMICFSLSVQKPSNRSHQNADDFVVNTEQPLKGTIGVNIGLFNIREKAVWREKSFGKKILGHVDSNRRSTRAGRNISSEVSNDVSGWTIVANRVPS